jgi:hypothetical protein
MELLRDLVAQEMQLAASGRGTCSRPSDMVSTRSSSRPILSEI